jgi:hypothetical protein
MPSSLGHVGGFGLALWGPPQATRGRRVTLSDYVIVQGGAFSYLPKGARLDRLRFRVSMDRVGLVPQAVRLSGPQALRPSGPQALRLSGSQAPRPSQRPRGLPGAQAPSRVAPPLHFLETPALFVYRVSLFFLGRSIRAPTLACSESGRRDTPEVQRYQLGFSLSPVVPFNESRLLPLHGAFHGARLVSTYECPQRPIVTSARHSS